MAAGTNKAIIIGRVTRDIELATTKSGHNVVSFSIALNKRGKDDEAIFLDVVAWNKAAEILAQYATKGKQVAIVGHLDVEKWQDKDTGKNRSKVVIVVDDFELLGSKSDSAHEPTAGAPESGKDVVIDDIDDTPIDLSEIPF